MLIPRSSTTALMCEPLFAGTSSKAQWFHDGIFVSNVSRTSNAILHNRTYVFEQTVPNVGFLIITNITLDDEGDYWCRADNGEEGEISHIIIAYINSFPNYSKPIFYPPKAYLGQYLIATCPTTEAFPAPTLTWLLNGKAIDLSTRRIVQSFNGSLKILQILHQDIGLYECILTNFAGRTSAKAFLELTQQPVNEHFNGVLFTKACQNPFRSGFLWFLIGCFVTCCGVLLYLICAMALIRSGSRYKRSLYPSPLIHNYPNLAPGFRKVVVHASDMRQNLIATTPN
ncbi:unnamed protein product [Thelazia callipaeda]|uniref:Ig-like domain-containing protein n=1 Tax=Thelazia callipaeda TaxID=103827 RepID=A0A158RCZ6_THECL|nr:unnamed protein product [Thelazia callipaeda]